MVVGISDKSAPVWLANGMTRSYGLDEGPPSFNRQESGRPFLAGERVIVTGV